MSRTATDAIQPGLWRHSREAVLESHPPRARVLGGGGQITFAQQAGIASGTGPPESQRDPMALTGEGYACAIVVNDLIGIVAYAPAGMGLSVS